MKKNLLMKERGAESEGQAGSIRMDEKFALLPLIKKR